MGEASKDALRLNFDRKLSWFVGVSIGSNSGVALVPTSYNIENETEVIGIV